MPNGRPLALVSHYVKKTSAFQKFILADLVFSLACPSSYGHPHRQWKLLVLDLAISKCTLYLIFGHKSCKATVNWDSNVVFEAIPCCFCHPSPGTRPNQRALGDQLFRSSIAAHPGIVGTLGPHAMACHGKFGSSSMSSPLDPRCCRPFIVCRKWEFHRSEVDRLGGTLLDSVGCWKFG